MPSMLKAPAGPLMTYIVAWYVVVAVFNILTVSCGRSLHMGVLVPLHGEKSMGEEVVAAAYLGMNEINSDASLTYVQARGFNFSVMVSDTGCDTGQGLEMVVKMVTDLEMNGQNVDAFIGPSCDNVCETAGLLAGRWSIPMISFGCEESKLSDRTKYPTFARTTSNFASMTGFVEDVLRYFGWDRLMLVTTSSQVWLETEQELLFLVNPQHKFNSEEFSAIQWNIQTTEWAGLAELMKQKGKESYVFLLLMFGMDVLKFMKTAEEAEVIDNEHVFIAIDFANMGKRIGHPLDGSHLTGLLDITMDVTPESWEFRDFVDAIQPNSTLSTVDYTNDDHCQHYEYGIHAGLMRDAMTLYADAVESALRNGQDPRNGSRVVKYLSDVTIQGVTGRVHIKSDGSRESHFMLHNLQDGCYVPVARSADDGRAFISMNNTVVWPGGSTVKPLGKPRCGWDGDLCDDDTTIVIAATSTVAAVVLIAVVGGLIYWRHEVARRDSSRAWVIHSDDLRLKDRTRSRSQLGSVRNMSPSGRTIMSDSHMSHTTESSYGQIFAVHYVYHGEEVAGKKIQFNNKAYIVITKQLSKEINVLMELSNTNLCKFYGVVVDMGQEMVVWEYCRKGSLQDVIHNDKKYLEDMPFKISFMNDITKGLRYLHHSRLGHHGRLKSSNVLVDNRWTCKLTHMVIASLARPDDLDDPETNYESFLSTPPEILRNPLLGIPGTRTADIYGFGMILLEIFTVSEIHEAYNAAHAQEMIAEKYKNKHKKRRKHHHHHHRQHGSHQQMSSQPALEGFFTTVEFRETAQTQIDETMDAKEIVMRLKQGGTFPFRPFIPEYIDHKTRNVIMECWREQPEERPSIDHVASLLRHISQQYSGKDKSLMEQMLDKVTREADLQAQELEDEKNKSDQLLYQMLPAMVADCLKKQIEVKPETFQSATVYFSDIQGFTELSSVSEPLEIVNFLNDVYYKFDNIIERYQVYKVETIGDAYVVCSGVPMKVSMHASEIAKMALHIMSCSSGLKVQHRPEHKFLMRIGLHSGPVAAGVVGRTMPRYCLFGDTVNTASRMESTGLAGHIQISQQCKDLLDRDVGFNYTARDPINVKGKGLLQTYFLWSKDGFSPAESTFFEETVSVHSRQQQQQEEPHPKPQMNGGNKYIMSPASVENALLIRPLVDTAKISIEEPESVLGSKLTLNEEVVPEVSIS